MGASIPIAEQGRTPNRSQMYSANTLNSKMPSFMRFPSGTTLPCALGLLGLALGVELALLSIVPPKRAVVEKRINQGGFHEIEPEFSTGQNLLIQPRLEAPALRSAWQELVEQSRAAAAKGDPDTAIKLLEEAEAQVPQQPSALAEVAVQFEKNLAPARAIHLWERIHQFGVSAGVYYSAADAKLNLIQAKSAEDSHSDSAGLPKAAPLRFPKFSLKDHPGSTASKRSFTLEVPVQKTGDATLEVRDVSVQVQFYEQVNARTLQRANASIRWKWASSPVDWQTDPTEVLEVEYRQTPGPSSGEDRRFFGYVASVYYKDKLLDIRADPVRLGQQYPPPRILPRDTSQ